MQEQLDKLEGEQSSLKAMHSSMKEFQDELHREVHKRATSATIWAAAGVVITAFSIAAGALAWYVSAQNRILKDQVQIIVAESFDPEHPIGKRLLDRLFSEVQSEYAKTQMALRVPDAVQPGLQDDWKLVSVDVEKKLEDLKAATEILRASYAKEVIRCQAIYPKTDSVNSCIDEIDTPVAPFGELGWIAIQTE